jgi:hypothetical protein
MLSSTNAILGSNMKEDKKWFFHIEIELYIKMTLKGH